MATHKSAEKRARQITTRRDRNRAGKKTLRTELKRFRKQLAEGTEFTAEQVSAVYSNIDKAAKHGFIHHNAAGRLKSRLSRQAKI